MTREELSEVGYLFIIGLLVVAESWVVGWLGASGHPILGAAFGAQTVCNAILFVWVLYCCFPPFTRKFLGKDSAIEDATLPQEEA